MAGVKHSLQRSPLACSHIVPSPTKLNMLGIYPNNPRAMEPSPQKKVGMSRTTSTRDISEETDRKSLRVCTKEWNRIFFVLNQPVNGCFFSSFWTRCALHADCPRLLLIIGLLPCVRMTSRAPARTCFKLAGPGPFLSSNISRKMTSPSAYWSRACIT